MTIKDYAHKALNLMDLTSLNDDDNADVIKALALAANTVFGTPAALCVYPQWVATARTALDEQGLQGVKIATVTNFPKGGDDIIEAVSQTQQAIDLGVDEVDVVFPYRALMGGDKQSGFDLVKNCAKICHDNQVILKVIIETGELKTADLIRSASEIAIEAGADFIKTSTGKVEVNATLEAARTILETIKASGKKVGFKAAGGVKTASEAQQYLALACEIMGEDFITSHYFRFGASSLLKNLLATLNDEQEVKLSGY